jgi:hypothetical protein
MLVVVLDVGLGADVGRSTGNSMNPAALMPSIIAGKGLAIWRMSMIVRCLNHP